MTAVTPHPATAGEPYPWNTVQSARRYNYWLGGKDHLAVDRASGDDVETLIPHVRAAATENRRFVHRATARLARSGITRFLDIGCGMPAHHSPYGQDLHTTARRHQPTARVLYIDNDPIVAVHARAFLDAWPKTTFTTGDLRDPDTLLHQPAVRDMLGPNQPVGVLLCAVLHYLDDHHIHTAISAITGWLPTGSYLAISHASADHLPADISTAIPEDEHGPLWPRTRDQLLGLLDGLTLIDPGLVPTSSWRPDTPPDHPDLAYACIARKP